ncbi:MAG: hypothetical protein IPM55_02430 [Acidobacteria bacterium]|nr:hypothetical protein [Acidobacteriota bacterium]
MKPSETKKPELTEKKIKAIEALLREPRIDQAAKAAGIGRATLWRWLNEAEFSAAYRDARARLLEGALIALESSAGTAIETLNQVMADQTAQASSRVSAAKATLELLLRLRDSIELEGRIASVEERQTLSVKTGRKLRITNEY